MIMQVHDELVFEVPEAELDWVKAEVPRLMASVAASWCRCWPRWGGGELGRGALNMGANIKPVVWGVLSTAKIGVRVLPSTMQPPGWSCVPSRASLASAQATCKGAGHPGRLRRFAGTC